MVQSSEFNEYPIRINNSMEKTKKKKTKIFLNWKIIIYGILLGIAFVLITWCIELFTFGAHFRDFYIFIKFSHKFLYQWITDLGVFIFGFLIFFIGGLVNYRILKKRREKRRKLKIQKMQTN